MSLGGHGYDLKNTIKVKKIEASSCELDNESNIPLLRELAGKRGTFIEKITDAMHIGLLPSSLGKLKTGIINNLNCLIPKYVPQLDGILVGYENLAMLGSNGLMIPGYHHIHINVRAEFYVFKPVVGGTLTGTVLKKSSSNITCLANKVFTVFVVLPAHLKRCLHQIQINQQISFTVDKIDLLSQIPFVKGVLNNDSLAPAGGGSHVRFDSPEPHEPDSGVSSIEDGSAGRSPASTCASSVDASHGRKHKRRDRDAQPADEPAPRSRPRKRRRDEQEADTSPRKAKKRHSGAPASESDELYLADPPPPAGSHKSSRRREQAALNGSVTDTLCV